jgi:type II restriction enzyme
MANKEDLRVSRAGTIINATSRQQESEVIKALYLVVKNLNEKFKNGIQVKHMNKWFLYDIVNELKTRFPEEEFYYHFNTSYLKPDGGILYIEDRNNPSIRYPILITEVKNQGTNDLREEEGLPKQAKGNAIERLGKNVIGFRTTLLNETIFPFVCFGYGCDFADDSSILDRVTTIAMFGELNRTYLHNSGQFNRGSFYFRFEKWAIDEMVEIMTDIASRSVLYYLSKYGENYFK